MSIDLVLHEFSTYYSKQANAEREILSTMEDKLRVSGFPYCGLRHLYKRLIQPTEYTSMGSDYYLGVGIATHSSIQHALGYGRQMYGNWKCVQPGCQGARIFSNISKCPACSSIMVYKEFFLDLRSTFPNLAVCLLDGIFRDSKGHYYVVDYKTTNSKTAKLPAESTYLPYLANIAQVRAYCALIELRFNIEIRGWLLHYVARDKPTHIYKTFGDIISTKAKKRILAKIKTYDKHYGMVMNCTDFSTVRTLIEEKPCTSREVYDKRYANFGGCPLSSICFNSKRLITEVSSQWEVKEPNFLTWRRPSKLPLPKL
jgi:hypothetical protein